MTVVALDTYLSSQQAPPQDSNSTQHAVEQQHPEKGDKVLSMHDALDLASWGTFQQSHLMLVTGLLFAADAIQVLMLSFLSVVLRVDWGLSSAHAASLVAGVFGGALVGTLILGPAADRLGRRPVFLVSAGMVAIFGMGAAVAPNYGVLLTSVVLKGIGVGGLTIPFDLLAEFAPVQQRGTSLLELEYFWTIGSLYVV